MMHRNLTTSEWTLMALESLIERGQLADWREFARALKGNERLARAALRVSEYVKHRASASLVRVLVSQRFPGLSPGGEHASPSLNQILTPIHDDFRRSGMTEQDLDALLEGELVERRRERGAAKD
ncbi:MAG TPA: hypothetical protein VKA15_00125 [Isosphaeraceae bacterium]|nr:hypothetical protein [Isosphaeraceae bacterium]